VLPQVLLQGVLEGFQVLQVLQDRQALQVLQDRQALQVLQIRQGSVGFCAWRCVDYQRFVGIESYRLVGEEGLLVASQVRQTPLLLQL
jgi:hypothetical protein